MRASTVWCRKLAVVVESEGEVAAVLAACAKRNLPLTFRAAGTSLSGQAISDSVLVLMGDAWNRCSVAPDGGAITLGPGVIGAVANRRLASLGRKIGPDPASIDSAMIGGIAANNASGMCCGTAQNSYRTLRSMRVVLADGTLLDTGDAASRAAFARARPDVLGGIADLARRVREDPALEQRIRHKYRMKNTTGYSLNALVDFDDPIDILAHLMIGSEGTLGYIAEVTARHGARASMQGERADAVSRPAPGVRGRHAARECARRRRRTRRPRGAALRRGQGGPAADPCDPARCRRGAARRNARVRRRHARSPHRGRAQKRSPASTSSSRSASRATRRSAPGSGPSARACSRRWVRCGSPGRR